MPGQGGEIRRPPVRGRGHPSPLLRLALPRRRRLERPFWRLTPLSALGWAGSERCGWRGPTVREGLALAEPVVRHVDLVGAADAAEVAAAGAGDAVKYGAAAGPPAVAPPRALALLGNEGQRRR